MFWARQYARHTPSTTPSTVATQLYICGPKCELKIHGQHEEISDPSFPCIRLGHSWQYMWSLTRLLIASETAHIVIISLEVIMYDDIYGLRRTSKLS